jgi:hypothetical protein
VTPSEKLESAPLVEQVALSLIEEAKRQNPDVWHDWLTEEEERACKKGDPLRHAWRIHSQHQPLDTLALAQAAIAIVLQRAADLVENECYDQADSARVSHLVRNLSDRSREV